MDLRSGIMLVDEAESGLLRERASSLGYVTFDLMGERISDRASFFDSVPRWITSKPATRDRVKTGHQRATETGWYLARSLLGPQICVDLGAPAPRAALEDVGVVEQAVEHRGDGGGVAEELAPVLDGAVRGEDASTPARSDA